MDIIKFFGGPQALYSDIAFERHPEYRSCPLTVSWYLLRLPDDLFGDKSPFHEGTLSYAHDVRRELLPAYIFSSKTAMELEKWKFFVTLCDVFYLNTSQSQFPFLFANQNVRFIIL